MEMKYNMLVVDDAEVNRAVLISLFEDSFTITEACDGMEALEILRRRFDTIDIVLLDLVMPFKDGFEVLHEMQEDPMMKLIPVVVISASNGYDSEALAIELGASDFVRKPIRPEIARARVKNALSIRKNERLMFQNTLLRLQEEEQERYRVIFHQTHTLVHEYDCRTGTPHYDPETSSQLAGNFDSRRLYNILTEDGVAMPEEFPALHDFLLSVWGDCGSSKANFQLRTPKGYFRWFLLCIARITDEDGKLKSVILAMNNIDEAVSARRKLEYLEQYDELTGILNKKTFLLETQKLLAANPNVKYIIGTYHIDNFRLINERYGFAEGDNILRYFANRLARRVHHIGVYGRLESDHFAFCVPNGEHFTEKLCECVEEDSHAGNCSAETLKSYGLYVVEDLSLTVSQMLDRATHALRSIKGGDSNRFAFFDEFMLHSLNAEQEVLFEMKTALENEFFDVYFQPKCKLCTGEIVGAEALVRWIHPTKGVIPPKDFIPIFERNGFIMQLDTYVWRKVCRLLREWLDAGKNPLPVSVNISRVNLSNPSLGSVISGIVEEFGLPVGLLQLEVTEGAFNGNQQKISEVIAELRRRGFPVLMDDFGSGYSSLNMLKDIHVDVLKLDMQFLTDCKDEDDRGRRILSAVMSMANCLELPVIAEGVETAEQAKFLMSIGCEHAQGYYYYRPMTAEKYISIMRREDV